MTFELMSNGTIAELPQTSLPEGINAPKGPFVILLLPHNRYLLGSTDEKGLDDHWILGRPGDEPQNVFLYTDESIKLSQNQDDRAPVFLSADTVTKLKKQLFSQVTPPGEHFGTAMTLCQLMKERYNFFEDVLFYDEEKFMRYLDTGADETLKKAYWYLRFALARREYDVASRIKTWIRAEPEKYIRPYKEKIRLWFSLQETPPDEARAELAELGFTDVVLQRILAQNMAPLIIFNPPTGYLLFNKLKAGGDVSYFAWAFLPPEVWEALRERKRLLLQDIITALWAEKDSDRALDELAVYTKKIMKNN